MHGVLADLLVILAVALGAAYALKRVGVPTIVGFLVAGMIVGPGGLSLVHDPRSVDFIGEIGVVFLLFTIGLKFSFDELASMRGLVFGAGGLQVVLTAAVTAGIALAFDAAPRTAVFLGLLVAQSSTAVVLKLLEERGEVEGPYGRVVSAVLLFQDVSVVPITMALPILAGGATSWPEAATVLGKTVGLLAAILVGAKFLLPRLMSVVAKARSREVFTLATMLAVIVTAYACNLIGLSLALGAFLAGVVLSQSDYNKQALSEVVPFRDLLASLFFVSVGMLVEPRSWIESPAAVFGFTALAIAVKAAVIVPVASLWYGRRVGVMSALALAQVGEFALILVKMGADLALVDAPTNQLFLSVAVLSIALTPLFMLLGPRLAARVAAAPSGRAAGAHAEGHAPRRGHVVIVGYGVSGRNVARVLRSLAVPYVILEMNPQTIKRLREEGHEALFGDASRPEVLESADMGTAKAFVVTMTDPLVVRQMVAAARRISAEAEIVVRTRFVSEIEELRRLGANDVVPEEFETALELVGRVMARYGASPQAILKEKYAIRREGYGFLRAESGSEDSKGGDEFTELLAAPGVEEARVPDESPAAGKTLRELDLRAASGASVIAVGRGGLVSANPAPDFALRAGDVLFLIGSASQIERARQTLT
jgi:CPA2 family monovalent cation:H+ antiporter-2